MGKFFICLHKVNACCVRNNGGNWKGEEKMVNYVLHFCAILPKMQGWEITPVDKNVKNVVLYTGNTVGEGTTVKKHFYILCVKK